MKAMVLARPGPIEGSPLELEDLPEPAPGPGEIAIRVLSCGLCHTDLHTVEGDLPLPRLPLVVGHQIVGEVEALGSGVEGFRPGDRVGVPWLGGACGRCRQCLRGTENLCAGTVFTGYHRDGGYAERTLAAADFALPLPAGFSDLKAAPLLCAGVIGLRALRRSGLSLGERIGLYGFGASAHLAIQIARHQGAEPYVFTRSEGHRRLAKELGAVWVGGPDDAPPRPLQRAVVFAPAGKLVASALRRLEWGGVVSIASITMDPIPPLDYGELLYGERELRGVTAATREDGLELLRLAAEIPLRTEVEVFPLAEANSALRLLKESRIRGAGVLQVSGP
jgi:propanol-preferring alcohol dehydrogenase